MKFRALIIAIVIMFVGTGVAIACAPKTPEVPDAVCDNGEHVGNPNCPTPTPTEPITITPTEEVTPTPSEEVTPTPTDEVTPTPTQEQPAPQLEQPSNAGGSALTNDTTQAPGARVCTIHFAAPILQGFKRVSATSVEFSWFTSTDSIDKQSIVYGYSENGLEYGVENLPVNQTKIVIEGLKPNVMVWAQVWNWKDGCAEKSAIVDP